MCKEKKRKKLLRDEKIEPYVVPDDWEPTGEIVKKTMELLAWLPQELADEWYRKWREKHLSERAHGGVDIEELKKFYHYNS